MRKEDETHRLLPERRVSSGLVGRLGAGKPEAVKRRDRLAVDLEEPQSQPPAVERVRGELAMKRLREEERRGGVPPALPVKMEQGVEISLEPLGVRGEAIRERPELRQPARKATHLLAEVASALPQELVPRVAIEAQHRTRLPVQEASTGHLPEALLPRDLLGEQNEARQRYGRYGL